MSAVCAWCGDPKVAAPICPKCGADYEKAAQIKAGDASRKSAPARSRKSKAVLRQESQQAKLLDAWSAVNDPALEYKLCLAVVPGMLAFSFMLEVIGIGDGFLRIVFGMPVHELGHALVGWFSGFSSIPTLWKTLIPEDRGYIAPILLFGALAYLIHYARLHGKGGLLVLGIFLVLLQFVCTFIVSKNTANIWVTWGGDGVGMMLATALMIGFTFDKRTNWYVGYLRWGFAFIGAAAFADIVSPWWVSLNDLSAVPYGKTGGTHTDTYKLVVYHGWEMNDVINRYVTLSVICMMVLVPFYVRGIKQCRKVIELRRNATVVQQEQEQQQAQESD